MHARKGLLTVRIASGDGADPHGDSEGNGINVQIQEAARQPHQTREG